MAGAVLVDGAIVAQEPSDPVGGTTATEPIRVFIVDDHELVRRGLRDVLGEVCGFEIVGEAGDAASAVAGILASRPRIALLDDRLPDGRGIEVCRKLRAAAPSVACLILTSFEDEGALVTAREAGAAGYLIKHIRPAELADALRRVAAGDSLIDEQVRAGMAARARDRDRAAAPADARLSGLTELTEQERRILALIAEGLTNRQIAGRMYLAEKTVKNYVSSLLAKLGLESRTQAAVFATKLRT